MKCIVSTITRFTIIGLFLLSAVTMAQAQFKAAVQGTITDSSGGLIPEAKVTLTNTETGKTQETTSSGEGFYIISGLPPGKYKLTVEKAGYNQKIFEDVAISAETVRGLDIALDPGEVSASVTITAGSEEQLETENANQRRGITTEEVRGLPQYGRDPYELLRLTPGIIGDSSRGSNGNSVSLGGQSTGPGGSNTSVFQTENQVQVSANGQRVTSNNYQVDGVSVNSLGWGGAAVITPNQESVKEVRILSSTYTAEVGRNSGAQIEVVSQNGTNQFHGSAFLKYDSPGLNAVNKFPGSTEATGRVNRAFRNYGGSIGGPLHLPRFGEGGKSYYSGRDRHFFFFSFEGLRENLSSVSFNQPIETADFRSYIIANRPNSLAARLFSTSGIAPRIAGIRPTACPGLPPGSVCQQLPGGLDIGSLNLGRPTGAYYGFNTVIDGTNQSGGGLDGIPDIQFADLLIPSQTRGQQYNVRLDFNRGDNQYAVSTYFTKQNSLGGATNGRPIGDIPFNPLNKAVTVAWVRTISPTMLNEARANFTRFAFNQVADSQTANFGIPQFNIFDFDTPVRCCMSIGANRAATTPGIFAQNTYEFRDTLTMVIGNQSLKVGGEIRREQDNNNLSGGSRPLYQFAGFLNFANDAPQLEVVDFDPITGGPVNGQRYFRTNAFALFVQDDWKFRPNLTINLGLRYEYFSPFREKQDRLSNYILAGEGLTGIVNGRVEVTPDQLFSASKKNFAPRLGIAYSPEMFHDKAVLRAGFGISYNRLYDNIFSDSRFNPPFAASGFLCCNDIGNPTAQPILYAFGANDSPFSFPINPAFVNKFDPATGSIIGVLVDVVGTPPHVPTPYVYNYSLEAQYSLPFRLVASTTYLGSNSHKLVRTVDLNRYYPGDTFDRNRDRFQNVGSNGQPCGPTNPTCSAPHATGNARFSRIFFRLPDVNANYNALIVRLTRNFSKGFTFDGNYTFGKSIDTQSFELGAQQTDPSIPSLNRGPSDYDVRHNLVLSALYNLPFFARNKGALGKVLGGFELSGIVTAHSGFPWTPSVFGDEATDLNGDGFRPDRPLAFLGGAIEDPSNQDFINGIFPRDATHPNGGPDYFIITGNGPAGIGRNSFRGPKYFSVDMSVAKTFGLPGFLSETSNFEIRANFFNVFNRLNLAPIAQVSPNTDIQNTGNFGRSTSGLAGRVVEFQGRFRF
ncbi:MAG TPA: TonB-dependent receptor [Pyrinomonadaceae bacterium]|nr:TonB-dependent receptor [Pyrinomonadaceae bacterium]